MTSNQNITNKEIIKNWVKAFNEADAEKMSMFYHDDAINFQIPNTAIKGKDKIKKMFQDEFAASKMVCIIENIFLDGNWAILEWKDPLGPRGCGFFQIFDNKIKLQRGYWDKLSFLKAHNIPLET